MNQAVLHYYRMERASFARTAEEALANARRHVSFRKRLGQMVKEGNRRSRAAKRGWKTRRAP